MLLLGRANYSEAPKSVVFSFFVACLCNAQYLVFVADEKGAGFHFVAFRLRIIHPAPQAAIIILIDPPLLEAGHFVPMFRLNRVL